MSLAELHTEAVENLHRSRQIISTLSAICPDWSTTLMIEKDFDYLEKAVHDFGRHQLGLQRRTHLPVTGDKKSQG